MQRASLLKSDDAEQMFELYREKEGKEASPICKERVRLLAAQRNWRIDLPRHLIIDLNEELLYEVAGRVGKLKHIFAKT